ncbi:Dopey-like protein [Microdochium nivale]|nr:Dopey-like protein [Microdochium nivale]
MALEPGPRRSMSPESSGRASPTPRQWRNQLSADDSAASKDKHYRKYASGVERSLSLFETALQEWADYISCLSRLLKALQARPANITAVPSKALVSKRLAQCLNPSLPSGVHQKALEVYRYIFSFIGIANLSRDLPLYLPGLATVLSFASLKVRGPFLDLLETYFLKVEAKALRPALKSIILALLPGLEEETSEDFDRTLKLVESFKVAIREPRGKQLSEIHSTGDEFFWQCFFLATITGSTRRTGALAYLVRYLPRLGQSDVAGESAEYADDLAALVTSPEPGLLLRCFAAGLLDDQLLIQRGFLDLLVTHLPLHSRILQTRVKENDIELLLQAAVGVVTRRDMSLNRRLWAWFLGPEPAATERDAAPESPVSPPETTSGFLASKTSYFEEHGLHSLSHALLSMINSAAGENATERARPYRICLSLMDRWEIGGLVVPEVFLPVITSVKDFKLKASTKAEFTEVLRSASVFFDGVESGLIYGELVSLMAQALGPGNATVAKRNESLALVQFIMAHFNIREEEMVTIHAPLAALAILAMMEDVNDRGETSKQTTDSVSDLIIDQALEIVLQLVDMVPERAFPLRSGRENSTASVDAPVLASTSNNELLKRIKEFYVSEQGNLEAGPIPFPARSTAQMLLQKACSTTCNSLTSGFPAASISTKSRLLALLLSKAPNEYPIDIDELLRSVQARLSEESLDFLSFKSMLFISTQLYTGERISVGLLSKLVHPLVQHAWNFLSLSNPKYHVEAVRGLWQLQSALPPSNREVEAAITELMTKDDSVGTFAVRRADPGRSFAILWTHTLQDNPSHHDRRGLRSPTVEVSPSLRLAGMDHHKVMLTRPLFSMLDGLHDERVQLFMTTKMWLRNMVGIEKLFLIFVDKFSAFTFLHGTKVSPKTPKLLSANLNDDADLDLANYYLRTLSNVLRWAPEAFWGVLATRIIEHPDPSLIKITGSEGGFSLQEFFLQVCLRSIAGNIIPSNDDRQPLMAQLHRSALTVLQQILSTSYAEPLYKIKMQDALIEKLSQSLSGPDPYVQVMLMDVVVSTLKLQAAATMQEAPRSPTLEKRSLHHPAGNPRLSGASLEQAPEPFQIPAGLLQCIQAGLAASNSRPVLDSWVAFLVETLPLFSRSIFQVLIPLVETLCAEVGATFNTLRVTFKDHSLNAQAASAPETTLISLLNALEQVLAKAHECLLIEESKTVVVKSPDQPQGFFGNMVSGVFNSEQHQTRSATANDRLTVLLAFQDAVRICFQIWSWGQGSEAGTLDLESAASFNYTSLRMRNRARRLLEHAFAAESLECLETVVDIWRSSLNDADISKHSAVFSLLPALDGSRPANTIPAIFNAIYSRSNPSALEPSRKSTLTISLLDTDLVIFLVDYAKSLEDDAMDEIWQDCMTFLRDLLTNPFPHRQTLPSLIQFAAILGEKVDNTNFGEQKRMRRELGDIFLRLLTALFTTRPATFADTSSSDKERNGKVPTAATNSPQQRADDVVGILAQIVPILPKILVESDRVLTAAGTISANVVSPSIRSKGFPETISKSMLTLLHELTRLQNNQKTWKKDIGDAFNDSRFFSSPTQLVRSDWLPLLRQWTRSDKERVTEILGRITPPTTAGIVFGVGATSARLEADRKTQLNLRRIATLILASGVDAFVADLPTILERLIELLAATATSSPSSTTRAEIYMVIRALTLRTSAVHLSPLWPIVNAEMHDAIASVVAPDNTPSADTFNNTSILQACKLLDVLVTVAPDDFQLHEWLFVTDTIDAIYRSPSYQPIALVDELSEELGNSIGTHNHALHTEPGSSNPAATGHHRKPLLGPGGINDELTVDRKDELVAKILRPFFAQLSIFAFESTYAMGTVDEEWCVMSLLRDLFDERSIVRAL